MERLITHAENFAFWLATTVFAAVAGGVMWLIRQVFTNQKQIDELRKELSYRDKMREDDRKATQQVREEIGEVRDEVRDTRDAVKRIEGMLSRP